MKLIPTWRWQELANRWDQGKALLVLGHSFSSTSIAAGKIYDDSKIPAISGSATALEVTQDKDWYFRVIFNNGLQAAIR